MEVNITMLYKAIPLVGKPISFDEIIKINKLEGVDPEDFKESMIRFMKKKVKKFNINGKDGRLTIHEYTRANIADLFKYFLLYYTDEELLNPGLPKSISLDTLYQAWKYRDEEPKEQFEKELTKYVDNFVGKHNVFYYDNEIFIRPYKLKSSSLGVGLQ